MIELNATLFDKVKQGASGNTLLAGEACLEILKEARLLPSAPVPVVQPQPPAQKQTFTPRVDKGHKMNAKKTGKCLVCSNPIDIGQEIYFKSGEGAKHSGCVVDIV